MSVKIKVVSSVKKKNFFCQLCRFPLASMTDFEKDESHGCCYSCYLQFAEARLEKWSNGWRPKREEVDSYIRLKNKISLNRRKK